MLRPFACALALLLVAATLILAQPAAADHLDGGDGDDKCLNPDIPPAEAKAIEKAIKLAEKSGRIWGLGFAIASFLKFHQHKLNPDLNVCWAEFVEFCQTNYPECPKDLPSTIPLPPGQARRFAAAGS